jgi:hypothetical protein
MSYKILARVALSGYLVLAAAQATAHHSVSGQFDRAKRVSLTGVITKVDWINPHTYLHLAVTDETGEVTMWQLESLPTAMLRKAGITSEMLMDDGSTVTVDVMLARDGSENLAWLMRIDYPDGHHYQLAGE